MRVLHALLLGFPQEAADTLDLIDQLLWVLGPADSGESGFVFFDLDETLITRDTYLIDGLGSTRFVSVGDRGGSAGQALLFPRMVCSAYFFFAADAVAMLSPRTG